MTPPINSVSDSELLELAKAFHDGPLMADDHEFVTDSGQAQWCLEVAKFFATELAARRAANTPVCDDETYEIGKRDGYEAAVQDIDERTGGDGEYRFCTDHDPDRHTPDAPAMIERIVARFDALSASPALPSQVVGEDDVIALIIEHLGQEGLRALTHKSGAFKITKLNHGVMAFVRALSCLTSPAAEPVAVLTIQSIDGGTGSASVALATPATAIYDLPDGEYPLFPHPAPSASREVTE